MLKKDYFQELMELNVHSVVPFDPSMETVIPLDLTSNNDKLSEELLGDIALFTAYINKLLENSGAKYAVGGYGEHRTVYKHSRVFDAEIPGDEPRRLHLGSDIWGKPYTKVMAPYDAIVHSFAFNNHPGDYGATLILSHHLDSFSFYTLYGHLSLNSIRNIQEGERVAKGDIIAEFGIPYENGGWPPHLHFQLILDLGKRRGDYPGVCKYSEKEIWLANSPDPDLLLRMNRYL